MRPLSCPRCGQSLSEPNGRCATCGITWRRPSPAPHGDISTYATRYRALLTDPDRSRPLSTGHSTRLTRRRRVRLAATTAAVLVMLGVALLIRPVGGMNTADQHDGSQNGAASAVLGYAACKGGPTVGSVLGAGAGGLETQVANDVGGQLRVSLTPHDADKVFAFSYEPGSGRIRAENNHATSILEILSRACAPSSRGR